MRREKAELPPPSFEKGFGWASKMSLLYNQRNQDVPQDAPEVSPFTEKQGWLSSIGQA